MKKSFYYCLLVAICLSTAARAQDAKPEITFAQKEFDFGTFPESEGPVVHDFLFTNTGKVPLILNDVKASCGCTTPEWTKEPVLPGKTGTIRVSYNPRNRPGSFSKGIQVSSNATSPTVALAIKGVVIPAEKMEDVYKYSVGRVRLQTIYAAFGELYKGTNGKYVIRVMNASHDTAVTLSFARLPDHLKVTLQPAALAPQQEGNIVLEYVTAKQPGWDYTVDRIDLLVNGHTLPNNRISITANLREDFSHLTPQDLEKAPVADFGEETFDFGTIGQDKPVEHVYTLTNRGKSNLYIRKVGASCGCTAVQPDKTVIAPGKSTTIKVVFNPAGREGNQKKAITVITNDPKRSKVILWLNGIINSTEINQASK